jgi:hypothetical protein
MRPERHPEEGTAADATSNTLAPNAYRGIGGWAHQKKRGTPTGPAARVGKTRLLSPTIPASPATTSATATATIATPATSTESAATTAATAARTT